MTDKPRFNGVIKPTRETYDRFQQAYEVLNKWLFKGELPNCLITLQRHKKSYGYFSGDRFSREDGQTTDEIALNPTHFRSRPIEEVLATLAHEMVHLWQHHFGKPGRGRYHNRQWADKMKEIGLQPTASGEEGGKETGDSVHHIIIPDGNFDRIVKRLLAHDFVIAWKEKPRITAPTSPAGNNENNEGEDERKSGKRVRYVCTHDECKLLAWARHEANLICGDHMTPMTPSS